MNISDIQAIISNDEHRELELKKSTGELKDAMHSACAFLNTDGGWLVFGIAPTSLKIIGQQVTDNTQREIAQALSGLEPAVDVRVEYVDIPDRPGFQIIAMQFLAIYDDRVEIENPGRLPAGVTPENIKLKHDSRPFNPLIAEILYKTSWLESWGSGVGRMVDACVQQHLPEPYYEIRPDGVAIIFKRVPKNQNDVTEKWPEKWPEKAMAIISLIESESGNVSVAQMETRLGIGHTTIKKILKAMQEAEMLRYEGPANGGHWEISKK